MYRDNSFFRALVENSMQSMMKSDFRLTAHLENDAQFGGIWSMVRDEYELTKRWVLDIAGQQSLMERNPHIKESIGLRDDIIRPLLVISISPSVSWPTTMIIEVEADVLSAVVRSVFDIINARRNRSDPVRTKKRYPDGGAAFVQCSVA